MIDNNSFSQMKLSVGRKVGKSYKTFMGLNNLTIDACKHLEGKATSVFLDMITNDFKKYSNMYHPCPFKVCQRQMCCIVHCVYSFWFYFVYFFLFAGSFVYERRYHGRFNLSRAFDRFVFRSVSSS